MHDILKGQEALDYFGVTVRPWSQVNQTTAILAESLEDLLKKRSPKGFV